ncbi:MAG TPA: hypothetical protein VG456_27630 [Candidatus Sulfopaludibacter sp.]|jgi:hypothetical protein|nr:hypothetical protein [Candidatus Sulfopaludibacter sp.]
MPAFFRLTATLALLLPVSGYAQNDAAGYILSASGSWTAKLNGRERPVKAGATVNPGDQLNCSRPDAILGLVLYDGTYVKCGSSGMPKCSPPIQVPPRKAAQGIFSAFLDRLQNKHLPPVAFVTSRGRDSGPPPLELRDAVVTSAGGPLDLSSVLSVPAPPELHLYIEPLDAPSGCGAILFKLAAASRQVDAGDFQPRCNGLYQLSATDASMQSAYPATLLFVAPGEQERGSRMLSEAAATAAAWKGAAENERRTYLRATLDAIQQNLRSSK